MNLSGDIQRINEIIQQIEKRTDKGDIKFMCAELQQKMANLEEKIKRGDDY
jgi:hypothetical protein